MRTPRSGYVLGLRGWYLAQAPAPPPPGSRTSVGLVSILEYSCRWPKGEPLVASCMRVPALARWAEPSHASPPRLADPEHCLCGIWAASDLVGILRHWPVQGIVYGYVAIWGRVRTAWGPEGEREWRGEFAYPQAILAPSYVDALAEAHGIERQPFPSRLLWPRFSLEEEILASVVHDYGVPIVAEPVWQPGVRC
ncbi:MAG TPA: hypothetical protein VNO79_09525 [Actinomycetota bacterium]|nr:hypothetical protein [Actinomycetota bacterium]